MSETKFTSGKWRKTTATMTIEFIVKMEVLDTSIKTSKIKEMIEQSLFSEAQILIADGVNDYGDLEEDFYQIAINSIEITKVKIAKP